MKLIDIQWGWITPGVGQANRALQVEVYLDLLEARNEQNDCFFFTQPGWALDAQLAATVRDITALSPERGKASAPLDRAQLARFRDAIERGQLVYLAYPYSGAVVEGMTGESVLRSLRLTRAIAGRELGVVPSGFLVHDGVAQLDWNAPMVPQIGRLAGFTEIFGTSLALIESPDGTRLPMIGQPCADTEMFYTYTEAPGVVEHLAGLEARFGSLTCATAADVAALASAGDLARVSTEDIRTKGWYGGAPLVMQMQAALRRTDLTLSLLSFNVGLRGQSLDLTDLWKSSLILQDCHLQWLLADLTTHYLPLARRLEADATSCLGQTAAPDSGSVPQMAFNPLPHKRCGVIRVGAAYLSCRNVAPGATAPLEVPCGGTVRATPTSLVNDRIQVELGQNGEILAVNDPAGNLLYQGAANQLRHWVNAPAQGEFWVELMRIWDEPFSGSLELVTEVDVPEPGTYPVFFDVPRGLVVAISANEDDWVRVTNAHWGGGLPSGNQDHGYSDTAEIQLLAGRNQVVLHAMADEGFKLRAAALRCGNRLISLGRWHARKVSAWTADPFRVDTVVAEDLGARAQVTFSGRFATCSAVLTLSLDEGSDRVDVTLTRSYAEPVYEGIQTLPLPLNVGSYLGSYCERPYVPAFTVEHATQPGRTVYSSDKPFGFAESHDSDRAWGTAPFRGVFNGMAPFLGIFTGIAEAPLGSVAMLTDGHGHFFRRRSRHQEESLGLSLGSSVIHPMTQSYRMPAGSYWEKVGRSAAGIDYEDARETFAFACPEGDITCAWSLLFSAASTISRQTCHQQLLESLFPLLPAAETFQPGFQLTGDEVVVTGFEHTDGTVVLRLLNLSAAEQVFQVALPFRGAQVVVTADMPVSALACADGVLSGRLPPHAVREFCLAM